MSMDKFLHERLYRGNDFTDKLNKFCITICGVGAIGSNLVDNLSRVGFSNLRVIDRDRVEVSNLCTQVYSEADVGALKADALKNKVFRNIGVEIESVNKELTESNVKQLLKKANLVVDCFDNNKARQLIQNEVRSRHVPCLHCGLAPDGVYGEVIWDEKYYVPGDVKGDICDYPLARNLVCLVVSIAAEEIVDFCLSTKPRMINWSVTLKDLSIRPLVLANVTKAV